MKRYIPVFALVVLTACNSNKPAEPETRTIQSTQPAALTADTTGLAQFQQWKAQNELATAQEAQEATQPVAPEPQKTATVVRQTRSTQKSTVRKPVRKPSTPASSQTPAATQPEPSAASTGTAGSGSSTSESPSTASAPATDPAPAEEKKGMSKSTKGAVIGGAGGAVLGAIINKKNRAAGAVIGGVLGAGVGYGIGKKKQKSDTTSH